MESTGHEKPEVREVDIHGGTPSQGSSNWLERLCEIQKAFGSNPNLGTGFLTVCYTIKMRHRKTYSKEEVLAAHSNAGSIGEFISNLGMKKNGGNFQTGRAILKDHGLEPPIYDRGAQLSKARITYSDEEWFVKDAKRSNTASKKRMLGLGYEEKCDDKDCSVGVSWNGKSLVLELDHIDGDMFNNELENLRLLCPNCHSQTDTFCNRGTRTATYNYCECGKRISDYAEKCNPCSGKVRPLQFDWPPLDDIIKMVKSMSWVSIGKEIGCSDNAVKKHLLRNGVNWRELK